MLPSAVVQNLLPTPCAHQSGNTPENHLEKKPGRKVVTDLAILVENDLLKTGGELPTLTPLQEAFVNSTVSASIKFADLLDAMGQELSKLSPEQISRIPVPLLSSLVDLVGFCAEVEANRV